MTLRGALSYLRQTLFNKEGRMLKPGAPAPDFVASDHLGKPIKMSDFLGKRLVFWFFPKANTPG